MSDINYWCGDYERSDYTDFKDDPNVVRGYLEGVEVEKNNIVLAISLPIQVRPVRVLVYGKDTNSVFKRLGFPVPHKSVLKIAVPIRVTLDSNEQIIQASIKGIKQKIHPADKRKFEGD